MKNEEAFLDLLQQKQELMFNMYCITKDTVLNEKDVEEDAEIYVELMEARNELVEKLKNLDEEMNSLEYVTNKETASSSFKEKELTLHCAIKRTAERIINLDRAMSAKIPKIREHFQREVKKLNSSKSMRSVYEKDYIFSDGYYLDKKN